jgi:Glycosyl hydrolase family 26
MHKGTLTNIFHAKTTHRIPKIVTLAVSSCLLVTMVTIDASASAYKGKDAYAVRKDVVLNLTSDSFRGLAKRWTTITSPITDPTATVTTTTTPTISGGGAAGSGGGGAAGSGGSGASGGGGGAAPGTTTTTTTPTTTTTTPTTTTTTPPATPQATGGLIEAGPSRSECLVASDPSDTLAGLQSSINNFQNATSSTVSCVGAYLSSSQTWTDWSDPWIVDSSGTAYQSWVAESPQNHQMVLEVDLIPQSLQDINDPLSWETACAAGDYNTYAEQLGTNLVNAGLQNSVIRLASEANGTWSGDFVGTTTQEQSLWATCFDNEVTGLRQATGEHFLIDWGINACTENIPYANYYPGNAYVDIVGLDLYDVDCHTPSTAVSFTTLANEPYGLASFEAFAAAQGKPMSFPEWGLASSPSGDDPGYVNGMASAVNNGNFAFQEYFDTGDGGSMQIDTGSAPQSAAAYGVAFK